MAESLETYLGAMITLSNVVPEQPVQSSIYALADLLPSLEEKLGAEDMKELITLGAFLWRKSEALGEKVLDIRHVSDPSEMQLSH